MVRTKDRERAIQILDISAAATSPQALRLVESGLTSLQEAGALAPNGAPARIELQIGDLLLSSRALSKMTDLIRASNAQLETIYAELPQTQQAALGLGFFVREKPLSRGAARLADDFSSPEADSASEQEPRAASGRLLRTRLVRRAKAASSQTPPAAFPNASTPDVSGDGKSSAHASPDKARAASSLPISEPKPARRPSKKSATGSNALTEGSLELVIGELSDAAMPAPDVVDAKSRRAADMGATLYRAGSLRSGQTVQYPGNVVILGDVHSGSEVIAGGSIVIWGELRGIAHAGSEGDRRCEIRALRISAIQLRIADVIARRPDRMYYHKPRALEPGAVTPERAAVRDGEIQIFLDVVGK